MTVYITGPNVVRLRASSLDGTEDERTVWRITLIDTMITPTTVSRPLHGLLRVSSPDGWGEIEVSAALRGEKDGTQESLSRGIVKDLAVETLYDFARSQIMPLLAQVRSEHYLPIAAPDHELRFISGEEFEELAAGAQ